MATIFFNYCINTSSKLVTYLQYKFLKHFIPFLLNSSPKRTNILDENLHLFCVLKLPILRNQFG